MTNWIYPEIVERVERACASFLKGQLDAKSLQATLYKSEQEIEAIEEKWLRSLLCDAENKLEEMTYTVSSEERKAAMCAVVKQLLSDMRTKKGSITGQ